MTGSGSTWWGLLLIVLGVLFLLDSFYDMNMGHFIRTWWPLLLVFWGVSVLLRQRGSSKTEFESAHTGSSDSPATSHEAASGERLSHSGTFGDVTLHVSSQSFRGGTVSTVFGDTNIDLLSAALGDGEHTLHVSGVFGDVTVQLPRDMVFSVKANAVFGDVQVIDQKKEGFSPSLNYQPPGFEAALKRLRIQVSQVFGDIVVRN